MCLSQGKEESKTVKKLQIQTSPTVIVAENTNSTEQEPETSCNAPKALINCLAKKYILLCCVSGGVCITLGILYLTIFFILRKYTSSMHYFQTMPTYIPGVVVSVLNLIIIG